MPTPAAPTLYQSVVPLQSYKDLAEQLNRYQTETGKIQEQRYQEVGTPAEIGARMAGRRVQEAGSYLASLPSSDKYLQQTTGTNDQFTPAKEAAAQNLESARQAYAEAMKKSGIRPEATINQTPSWAQQTTT